MLVPTHPALLANSGFEDLTGGYSYSPPRMTQTLGPSNAEASGGRKPSIHMRRRRCSATPVLTGRASSIPSPHSPAIRGSPSQTPRRASTPLPASTHMMTRHPKPAASFAFSTLLHRPSQDSSARADPGLRGPSPSGQGSLAGPNQAYHAYSHHSTEDGGPSRAGAVPGLGSLPHGMADPRGSPIADLTNGTSGTRPPPQPRQGGIDPSSPYHLSQLTIPSPRHATYPASSNSPAAPPGTPATAIYRPDLPGRDGGLGAPLGRGVNLSGQSGAPILRRDPPNDPTIEGRGNASESWAKPNHNHPAPSTLARFPPLSVSINGVGGSTSNAFPHSARTQSLSLDTADHSRAPGGQHDLGYDLGHDRTLHPSTPLTARPLPHSERTPTMSHTDLTPIAPSGRGSHMPLHLAGCPPMSPLARLHAQAPLNWCNKRTSDLVLVVPTHTWDGRLKTVGSRDGGETGFTLRRGKPPPGLHGTNGFDPPPLQQPAFSEASVPSMGFAVHSDYLRVQSGLLNRILSGAAESGGRSMKGCCMLPALPGSPTDKGPDGSVRQIQQVLVPLPDPRSFPFLLHWLYWGDVRAFERALSSGTVNWNGVIANADFLDVDTRTKKVVAHWWRRWVQFSPEGRTHPDTYDSDDDADNEEDFESDESMAPLSEKEQQASDEMTKLLNNL